jgi:hypothetical protein
MKINKPATPSGLKLDELNGALLLIWAHRVEKDIATVHGPKDAIAADVHVLDGDHAGEVYRDTLVFPAVLQAQLRSSVGSGDPTLGRLGKGLAKKGQSAPWLLVDASDDDEKRAAVHVANLDVGAGIGTAELGETSRDDQPPF